MPSVRNQKRRSVRPQEACVQKVGSQKAVEVNDVLEEVSNNKISKSKVKKESTSAKANKRAIEEDTKEKVRSYELIPARSFGSTQNENPEFSLKITDEQQETEILNSGDCVLVYGPKENNYYAAKVLSFYKNQFTDEINVSIKWFYTKGEIPRRILPDETHKKELFVSAGRNAENIDAESIFEKCSVIWISPHSEIKQSFGKKEFFFRRSYDGKTIADVLSAKSETKEISKAEQRNGIISPKRIRQTPSRFSEYEGENIRNETTESTPKLRSAKKAKIRNTPSRNSRVQEKTKSKSFDSPSRSERSQIKDGAITSPVSASGYGKLEASAVAFNILNSDEYDDDDDDDSISVSSTSSKASEIQKPITKISQNKTKLKQKMTSTGDKKRGKIKLERDHQNSVIRKKKLIISIPKSKLENASVAKLRDKASSTGVRSSPRRRSVIINEAELSDGEYDDKASDESSSGESYVDPTPSRKTPRRCTPKSTKRVRITENKTTVTPILIKMPRNKLPFIPARPTPVRSTKGKLEKSRERLHVSAIPECLPCRENEFQEIYTFVEGKIRSGGGGCMYVSGVPGTGKTATVREVMNTLRQSVDEGDIPEFTYVDINGMRLTEPRQAYVQILLQLTNQKATADHAANLLTKLFSQRRKTSTVVLADELDLLWTKKQDVLYHLFDWPTHRHAKLIVVAIANTMDLPERILMNRVASRLGLTRLTFRPYTFKQLQEIVTSRLDGLDTFEGDAIQLASRKVAAVSGDARRCLDICRRATEIAERKKCKVVGIEHVHNALQEMFATPMIQAIRSCSKHEQLFLHAVVAEFRRSGMEEATLGRIIEQHTAIAQLEGVPPVTVTTLVQISQRLATNRLILLEGGHRDLYSRIRLNVSVDDVLFALKQ